MISAPAAPLNNAACLLRQSFAAALQQLEGGLEPSFKAGIHSLQLGATGSGLKLECTLAFGQPFTDEVLKGILEYAMADLQHFHARLLIDQEQGQMRLLRVMDGAREEDLWHACEQMANQADVWIDMICRHIWLESHAPKRTTRGSRIHPVPHVRLPA